LIGLENFKKSNRVEFALELKDFDVKKKQKKIANFTFGRWLKGVMWNLLWRKKNGFLL
jgi:hypothetical protein